MKKLSMAILPVLIVSTMFSCLILVWTAPSHATLFDRGGGLIYDDFSDITWLQDANYAITSGYIEPGARMDWEDAMAWAEQLDYRGYQDWRLPSLQVPTGGPNPPEHYTEFGHLYYIDLGNIATVLFHSGPFVNLNFGSYWSCTETPSHDDLAKVFTISYVDAGGGAIWDVWKANPNYLAWAVRDGDVTPVPLPSTFWLSAVGLLSFGGMSWLKRRPNK